MSFNSQTARSALSVKAGKAAAAKARSLGFPALVRGRATQAAQRQAKRLESLKSALSANGHCACCPHSQAIIAPLNETERKLLAY